MITLKITNEFSNTYILTAISNLCPQISYSTLCKLLRKKDIKVNGKRISENIKIMQDDIIDIYYENRPNIIFEDENLIIVNKPVGIEVNKANNSLEKQLSSYLKTPDIYPCHRLDRNTTGLVIFAKNKESLSIIEEKIKDREIQKFYKCRVIGHLKQQEETLNAFLFKDSKKSMVYISSTKKAGYLPITTKYKVLSTDSETSYLEIELITGRTHQIRAHLAYIGHSIIGDNKYGNNEINKKYKKKYQDLVAYKLIFNFKTDAGILNYLNKKEICLF